MEILSRTGNIYFNSGSARLDRASLPLLSNLHDIISRCPDLRIEVGGHTDSVGTSRNNLRLSDDRANAVVDYLVSKGLNRDTIIGKGYGEDSPIADNATRAGRDKNRRIEFKVLEN